MTTSIKAAPPIQGPSAHALAELLRRIEGGVSDGPCFMWDPGTLTFLTAVIQSGTVVTWQIDPAPDKAAADALRDRAMQAAVMAAMAISGALPAAMRDELQQTLARGLVRASH